MLHFNIEEQKVKLKLIRLKYLNLRPINVSFFYSGIGDEKEEAVNLNSNFLTIVYVSTAQNGAHQFF